MDTKRDKNKTTKTRVGKVESMLCVKPTRGRGARGGGGAGVCVGGGGGGGAPKTEKEDGSGTSEGKD